MTAILLLGVWFVPRALNEGTTNDSVDVASDESGANKTDGGSTEESEKSDPPLTSASEGLPGQSIFDSPANLDGFISMITSSTVII